MEIINFDNQYAAVFKTLNMEWLDKYSLTEAHDLEILNDPQGAVIDTGGCIFLVKENDVIAGCAGLMKIDDDEYELIKMTVAPAFRGKGISKVLIAHCIEKAKQLKAKKISLLSNHQLTTALQLYKQFGFTDVVVGHTPYELADVKMELMLEE